MKHCKECEIEIEHGHYFPITDEYMCCGCMKKLYTNEQIVEMYQNGEQYYTEYEEEEE
ncbi:MAG: hypothetical protein R3Y05_01230 [bacterium]